MAVLTAGVTFRLAKRLWLFQTKDIKTSFLSIKKMPSVTICVPARNEGASIEASLQSILASAYPKLEILVLDDESIDDTYETVRLFAHEGVRFIASEPLPDGWIGKNYALEQLTQQATGEYVIFMSVDTRIKPDTVAKLVAYANAESADILSVIPRRVDLPRSSVFLSTLRFLWAILTHTAAQPSAVSSLWMIKKATLVELGGFTACPNLLQPEQFFAEKLQTIEDKKHYRLLISNHELGVSYEKKRSSQIESALRTLAPRLKNKRYLLRVWLGLTGLIVLLPVTLLSWWLGGWQWGLTFSSLYIVIGVIFSTYYSFVWGGYAVLGNLIWWYVVLQEWAVLTISFWRFWRQKPVSWRGRTYDFSPYATKFDDY